MDTVNQIDVDGTGTIEHRSISRRSSVVRVARRIVVKIRFGFINDTTNRSLLRDIVDEIRSQEIPSQFNRW